jgi:NAD+ synthase
MTEAGPHLNADALNLDWGAESERIEGAIVRMVGKELRRRGVVVGVSGGIDSAVCVSLAARALGAERVFALLMPEKDGSPDSTARAKVLCEQLGVPYQIEDIGPALEALGCYRHQEEAAREVFPDYVPGQRFKITIAGNVLDSDRLNYFNLVVESETGELRTQRMPASAYLRMVAAVNMKQRTRKQIEYFHADRLNYAVIGTPNRLEYALGFFVRGGDGLADLKPIAHLYKTQVYALAEYLDVTAEIRAQTPSTDTYSLSQTQEEFYFALPYREMDFLLYASEHGVAPAEAARSMNLSTDQVERVYRDIVSKRRASARGLQDALLVAPVDVAPA